MFSKKLALLLSVFVITIVSVFFVTPDYLGDKFRPWRLGLDLVGGSHLVYEVDMSQVESIDRDGVLSGLRDVIERRVNLFGVSEPQIYTAKSDDSYRLVVELAGIKDVGQAINQIGETPFLVFAEIKTVQVNQQAQFQLDNGEVLNQDVPIESEQYVPTDLNGGHVKVARLSFNQVTGAPEITLGFNTEGAGLFEEITARNVGKKVAIFLDGEIISDPVVNEAISGGTALISGQFTLEDAKTLVERFNAGALPAPITLISQQTVGATLGESSLRTTLIAGLIGTLLVMVFMIMYYKKLGIFASVALLIYIVLLLAVFKLFGITMTLAGIAGIILTIGMAVDANILIFERTNEELSSGGSVLNSIQAGFSRAWPSIRDSNITTIITSLILYTFTSSFVKGFALSLLFGILVSMFTAITVTKSFLEVFIKEKSK
ncbi:MAG: protein translocase subunit SecD [Candidatus Harrisonbacteria bacterium CG10_big_fil_rev_8_21_14_0_10_38_8]|uniref:Protein translocase subunit SecD n=1 Tax=Candidatus Harrisonbacteria bacterium CG10_big_fil_rev_8_21_14_0_10_38_8 TaxID=1974582 RepID=A0A2M6WKG3_9BACT|nr:MAG: protein translocase subunit SecD [Candidatus Harrisonbacteria bacterium CG10_big_fil_rev_8_21_14_0_10_38_8]